jgi:predicted  nucleic acid-binding Zn-ribbon protein
LEAVELREKLKVLAELQKIDLDVAALQKAAEAYPKQLAELDKELGAARSALEAERNRLLDVERQRRTLEQNIADEKDKVKKWESRLTEQRSTREYAALAREIDIAKKGTVTSGEEVTELGKQANLVREAVKTRDQELAARTDQVSGKIAEIKKQMEGAKSQTEELLSKRGEAAKSVDRTLLGRYDQVRKKRMPALAAVVGGTCQGCNMNVPPQLYNTLRSTMGTDLCPSCHRIIYAADALEQPGAK